MDYWYSECGCCGHYHPVEFTGDCRSDAHHFTADQLESKHGTLVWNHTWTLEDQMDAEEKADKA